jgi:hypothetical protein
VEAGGSPSFASLHELVSHYHDHDLSPSGDRLLAPLREVRVAGNAASQAHEASASKRRKKGSSNSPPAASSSSSSLAPAAGDDDEVKYVELVWNDKLAKRVIAPQRGVLKSNLKKATRCVPTCVCVWWWWGGGALACTCLQAHQVICVHLYKVPIRGDACYLCTYRLFRVPSRGTHHSIHTTEHKNRLLIAYSVCPHVAPIIRSTPQSTRTVCLLLIPFALTWHPSCDPLHRAQDPSSRGAKSYHEVFHHSDAPRSDVDAWEQGDVTALPPPPAPPRAHLAVSFGISSARNNGAAGGEPDYEDAQDVREFVASELVGCASFIFFALALRPVGSLFAPLFFGLALCVASGSALT